MTHAITTWGTSGVVDVKRVGRIRRRAVSLVPADGCSSAVIVNRLLNINDAYQYFALINLFKNLGPGDYDHIFHEIRRQLDLF